MNIASTAFAALGHPARLAILRHLIQAGPGGCAAGEVAQAVGMRPNTLSPNLSALRNAGLIRQSREGRVIRCFADMPGIGVLIDYLTEDCCGGCPDLCQKDPS